MQSRGGSSWSLARRILLLQIVVLVVVVGSALVAVYLDTRAETDRGVAADVSAIAGTVACSPSVRSVLAATYPAAQRVSGPSAELRSYASSVANATSADFVVIMWPDGTRLTHPDPAQIGHIYLGNRAQALDGHTYVETFVGTLGPSIRAITPVMDSAGRTIGLVAVGITVGHVSALAWKKWVTIGWIALGALLIGLAGTVVLARWVRWQTLDMGPRELADAFRYYDAVLESVHEGLVLLDPDGRIAMVNRTGRRLLGIGEGAVGRTADAAGLPGQVKAVVDGGALVTDQVVVTDERVLAITTRKAERGSRVVGQVVSLRDQTELESLTGELDRIRGFSDALRAQAHESANKLHTVVSLIELGEIDRALEFAVSDLRTAQTLADQVMDGIGDRAVAALLLAKSSQAAERGVELVVDAGSELPEGTVDPKEMVVILGNLIDNGCDAAADAPGPRQVTVKARQASGEVVISVVDSGSGLTQETAELAFSAGWSTKPATGRIGGRGLGLALVRQAVHRCGGSIETRVGPGGRFTVRLPSGAGLAVRGRQ